MIIHVNKNITISQIGLPIDNIQRLYDNFRLKFSEEYTKLIDKELDKENNETIKTLSKKIIKKYCLQEYKRKPEVQTHIVRI